VFHPCNTCGNRISFTSKPVTKPYGIESLTCEICHKKSDYKISWVRYRNEMTVDPYFGMEIWMKVEVGNNVLWIYNLEHLDYLRTYVMAKLREDNSRHKYSMITNLPSFIKSAKNRDVILKKINKMEAKLNKSLLNR
jgi:hypothetical protein